MILDNLTLLSDDQSLVQSAGDYYSDVLNTLGDAGYTTSVDAPSGVSKDIGKGYPIELLVQATADMTSGGTATLTVYLETATDEAFTSPVTLLTSETITVDASGANIPAGAYLLPQHVPYGALQWLRVKYTIGTAAVTAGTVTAGVVCGHQSNG